VHQTDLTQNILEVQSKVHAGNSSSTGTKVWCSFANRLPQSQSQFSPLVLFLVNRVPRNFTLQNSQPFMTFFLFSPTSKTQFNSLLTYCHRLLIHYTQCIYSLCFSVLMPKYFPFSWTIPFSKTLRSVNMAGHFPCAVKDCRNPVTVITVSYLLYRSPVKLNTSCPW